jgi:ATP citrate (pro-S)-lyase
MKFTKETKALFYNLKALPIQQMLDFDFLSKREPSVEAIIHPGRSGFHKTFFGNKEILIPIYSTTEKAVKNHDAEVFVNFASFRSAFKSSKEALSKDSIKTLVIVAEGIPERQIKELITLSKDKMIIGPSTVGGISAGKFRIGGYAGGKVENILSSKLYRPGSVGLVSKSGGMMNEMFSIISRTTDGINEGLAIGGDVFPGSTLLQHILRFENNEEIKMIVCISELGGRDEYDIIQAKKEGKITKPIVMWVSGSCASIFPWEVQFGHAGAKKGKKEESAESKNSALKEAGIYVPESFEKLEQKIAEVFKKEVGREQKMEEVPTIGERRRTNFTSTISNEEGELTYNKTPISKIVSEGYSLGQVIGLLWFKKKLPRHFSKFLDLSLVICADHGPAVPTAHNSIVAARAGKDIVSSLISGMTTIGSVHGGAIDGASRYFKEAVENGVEPKQFVADMKKKGLRIPGIGHRVKSKNNPDKRVELLKEFSMNHFPSTKYLDYALEVEKITLQKAENLILNVDGCVGVMFLDALSSSEFSEEEIGTIIEIGYLNGLFALSRSIGMIGHILDQKRLKEPLYRHNTKDILYL